MTELKDTIEDMLSDDHKRRYKAEYRQLCTRIAKLVNYLKHHIAEENNIELVLKEQQLDAMIAYKNILELRAKIENIEI